MTANNMRDDWWKQAVVYQIYPRSFKDVNGDGLGDIAGVTEKMDYLKNLGIDAIWLSPFYPSDLADGGYDVIDYRNVDPRLGTMADFDAMAAAAHEAGIKVIVDIVPNHTSNKHKMFIEALAAGRGSAARDRYIFREGRGEHGELPPNDWQSLFGGPAWQQVDDGQWYLHMFAKEQPDLNWKNPDVHEEFKKTLRFWSDHGTDGFRIDVAHGLAKDLDSVPLADMDPAAVQHVLPADGAFSPLWDRPEVHDIYREWRQVFNEYNPPRFAVGEAWVKAESQHLYASTDELGQVFNFEFDVGHGQLDPRIAGNERIIEMSGVNIRDVEADDLPYRPSMIVSDVSFISLTYVIPVIARIAAPGAHVVLLVKPQFEVGKGNLGKNGIVESETLRKQALDTVTACAKANGLDVRATAVSPIEGTHGNIEYLLYAVA